MTRPELEGLLERFADRAIGVVGDFALDCYWKLEPGFSAPSVETGKPTQPVSEQRYAPGAAGNVAAGLLALGCGRISVFGLVGRDPWGAELRKLLDEAGADVSGLLEQERDWATVAYAKPHAAGVEQSRIDFGDFNRIRSASADALIEGLARALPDLDALVINAQARSGIHGASFRRRLQVLLASRPQGLTIVDSRDPEAIFEGCILKVNASEAARLCGMGGGSEEHPNREQVLAAAAELFSRSRRPVFVTRGRDGLAVHDRSGVTEIPGIALEGETDATGAGDAALAAITAALAAGAAPPDAAFVGNLAAAVCVSKVLATGPASVAEILSMAARAFSPSR